jgi:transcriptional regulator with XRE-family HTH domain
MIFMMGDRLREILSKEGKTAYRVCKDLGIDQGEMSRFINKKVNLTLSRLEMVADYLGYDLVLVKRKPPRKGVKK